MKLPEKMNEGFIRVHDLELRDKINQLIDYLAEREGGEGTPGGAGYDPRYKDGKASTAEGQDGYTSDKCNICDHKEPHTHSVSNGPIKKTITLPKPEWWDNKYHEENERRVYKQALEAASKALGVIIKLED